MAIAYLGQSIYLYLIPWFLNLSLLASWLVANYVTLVQKRFSNAAWCNEVFLTSFALSMAVNTLVTGLILFKILKVFFEVKATVTSVERSLGSTGGTKLRHIIFIMIESGMAMFAIQLIRLLLYLLPSNNIYYLVIGINEMINVIMKSVSFLLLFFFVLLMTFTWLGHHTDNHFGAGLNEIVLRWQRIIKRSCRKSLF